MSCEMKSSSGYIPYCVREMTRSAVHGKEINAKWHSGEINIGRAVDNNVSDNLINERLEAEAQLLRVHHRPPQWKPYQMSEYEKKMCPGKDYKWDVSEFYLGV